MKNAETMHGDLEIATAVTNDVKIQVETGYSNVYSSPPYQYFFTYHITISNLGDRRIQLVSRRWSIRDATGREETVEGPGVVGEQPYLLPGESFEYTSGCPLHTSYGEMSGSYQMLDDDGNCFHVEIPRIKLVKLVDENIN
jgi:ApaG protein